MRKNIVEYASKYDVPERIQLTVSEIDELHNMEEFKKITTAFDLGYAVAMEQIKREQKRSH